MPVTARTRPRYGWEGVAAEGGAGSQDAGWVGVLTCQLPVLLQVIQRQWRLFCRRRILRQLRESFEVRMPAQCSSVQRVDGSLPAPDCLGAANLALGSCRFVGVAASVHALLSVALLHFLWLLAVWMPPLNEPCCCFAPLDVQACAAATLCYVVPDQAVVDAAVRRTRAQLWARQHAAAQLRRPVLW